MDRRHVEAYLARDWARVAKAKDDHWRRRKGELGAAAALRVADALRNHAKIVCPTWPTSTDREEDLEAHRTVSEKLRRASSTRPR